MKKVKEEWRPIPFDKRYEVSNLGNVRSWCRKGGDPKEIKQVQHKGYMRVHMPGGWWFVHRLVLLAFIGESSQVVCHNDGDPSNNKLSNLRYDSHCANMADKKKHGTSNIGDRNGNAKIKAVHVFEIRKRLLIGEKQISIAKHMAISTTTVSDIATGKTWAWLNNQEEKRIA